MDRSRRKFFKTTSSLLGSLSLGQFAFAAKVPELAGVQHATLEAAAADEEFWHMVRQAYTSSGTMINLNNGGVSPQPRVVQDKQHLYTQFANEAPGYYMWRVMGRERKQVHRQLAELAGCSEEEVAIVRNTTDALETVLQGIDWKAGDEVLTTDQDYPSLLNTLSMLEQRYGIQVRKISLPVPAEEEVEILQRFEAGISGRTRAMLFCHVINITGQILPAKSLCDLARKNGILSIVDGAHSFGQLDFRIDGLGCDYFGTSLHKWLCAPFGTGMLYVAKDRILQTWPACGYPEGEEGLISKFEHVGTRSFPAELAIAEAIQFHQMIGTDRKGARLQYLNRYWIEQLQDVPEFYVNSPRSPEFSSGIVNVGLTNWEPRKLGRELLVAYDLYNTVIDHPQIKGVRITPHVYTSLEELDHLVRAFRELAEKNRAADE